MALRVLVVDDEPEMAALVERGLQQDGYDVVVAHDGIAAAAALHALAGLSAMIGADELSRLTRFGEATLAALAPQDCLWMGDAIVACAMRLQSAIDIAMAAPGETMTIEPTGGAN